MSSIVGAGLLNDLVRDITAQQIFSVRSAIPEVMWGSSLDHHHQLA